MLHVLCACESNDVCVLVMMKCDRMSVVVCVVVMTLMMSCVLWS